MAFVGSGFAFASWASRIPQVRVGLALTPAALGVVLLSIAAGSVVSLPLSGTMVHRFGSRRMVAAMAALLGAALVGVGCGYLAGVVPVIVALFALGFANGAWDVGMNVQAARVERAAGRSIMSRFHAGYSVGTVAGALVGALMVLLGVPVTAHLTAVGILVAVVVPLEVRRFLPDEAADVRTGDAADDGAHGRPSVLARWRERRTVLIGLFVLAFAFTEGAGNDWISVALIDGYHLPAAAGTLGFAAFLSAMTLGRWYGTALLDRFGRVAVLRTQAVLAAAGIVVFVVGSLPVLAYAGALLWGAGASLGFPTGMSAAADEPGAAASRVSVVASIGYFSFLGGPPLIGVLGDAFGVLRALVAVAVALCASITIAGALRPPAAQRGVNEAAARGTPAA